MGLNVVYSMYAGISTRQSPEFLMIFNPTRKGEFVVKLSYIPNLSPNLGYIIDGLTICPT